MPGLAPCHRPATTFRKKGSSFVLGSDSFEAPTRTGASNGERSTIARVLEACAGNQTRAARVLGVSRRTLVNKLNKYKMPRPLKRGLPRA